MSDPAALATTEAPDTCSIITGGRRITLIWEERRNKGKAPEQVQESVRRALAKERGEPEKPVEKSHGPHVKHAVRAAFALANAPPAPKLEPKAPEIVVESRPEPVLAPAPKKIVKAKPAKPLVTRAEFPSAPTFTHPEPAIVHQQPEPVAQKPVRPRPTAKAFAELQALLDERRADQEDEEKWILHFIQNVLNGEMA